MIRDDPAMMAMMSAALDEAIAVGAPGSRSRLLPEETLAMVRSFPTTRSRRCWTTSSTVADSSLRG